MPGAPDDATLYLFERESEGLRLPPAKRTHEEAVEALRVLRQRLAIPADAVLAEDLERLLLRYCSDTILNVGWYDHARKREQRGNARRTALMVALMVVALALLLAWSFTPLANASAPGSAGLPFAVLAGAALTVLQVIASLGDGKARLAIFWKAGADLKEALYTFEQKWHRRDMLVAGDETREATEEFTAAVHEELRIARAVTRTERLEFFATLRSPADVLAVATAAADGLRARRADVSALVSARDERLPTAKKSAVEARAAVLASEFRLRALADGAEKTAEEAALVKAKSEVVRTEAILQDLVGG